MTDINYPIANNNEFNSFKEEYANHQNSNNLKIASIERELNDYKSTMANVNINQEAKQTASGYGIVSLPKNAANGQVSVSVKGLTTTNLVKNGSFENDFDNWTFVGATPRTISIEHKLHGGKSLKFNSVKQSSGMYQDILFSNGNKIYVLAGVYVSNYVEGTAVLQAWGYGGFATNLNSNANVNTSIQDKWQKVSGIVIATNGGIRLYPRISQFEGACYFDTIMAIDLTQTFGAGNEPTEEQCDKIFANYFDGTKSTDSASRLKSVGKNLANPNNLAIGVVYSTNNTLYPSRITSHNYDNTTGRLAYTTTQNVTGVGFTVKIKPNTLYTYKYTPIKNCGKHSKHYYDKNMNFLLGRTLWNSNSVELSPENAEYVTYGIIPIASGDVVAESIQIEEGEKSTTHEPYTESNIYIPNVGELRSLPNGVADEIRVSGGKAELIKRVNKKILQASDIKYMVTGYVNLDYVTINKPLDSSAYASTLPRVGELVVGDVSSTDWGGNFDNVLHVGKVFAGAHNSNIWVGFAKGTTLVQAQTALSGLTLTYQLAEPIITPIEVSGTLLSNPSGTVYVENVVADAGLYTDKLNVLDSELPIDYIEKLSKVDFNTGVETELDSSKCVIAEDKLSFTHPDLTSNDIVFFTYFHNLEGTQGETTIEYYDSRHVLKDTVTGKFYKIVPTVADGVLTNQLVEV
jgi:hypothetical protein